MNKPIIYLTASLIAQQEIGMTQKQDDFLEKTYLETLMDFHEATIGPILCVYMGLKGPVYSIASNCRTPIDPNDETKKMPFNAEAIQKYFMHATHKNDKLIVTELPLEEEVIRTLGNSCAIQRI